MRLIIATIAIFFTTGLFAQEKLAAYCGAGCRVLKVEMLKRTDKGIRNSTVIDITNRQEGTVKVKVFVKRGEEWLDLGTSEPLAKGKIFTFHYNRNDLDGDYAVYYANYPSSESFPTATEVKNKMDEKAIEVE